MSLYTERWIADAQLVRLSMLVDAVRDVPGLIVEIGVFEGRSLVALANAAHPRVVFGVDHFQGDIDNPNVANEGVAPAKMRGVEERCWANLAADTRGNAVLTVQDWREFATQFQDEPVALLHLDAAHDQASVQAQLDWFRPRMSPGGVLCGDDWSHPGVRAAVLATFGATLEIFANMWVWRA